MSESRVATLQDPASVPDSPPDKKRTLDVAKALRLRLEHGLSYEEIGIQLCPEQPFAKQSVLGALQRFESMIQNPDAVKAYRENKGNVMEAVELRMMASLADEDCIAKASLNNRAYAFKQIHEARRLEAGQSTSNLGVLTKHIQAVDAGLFPEKSSLKTKGNSDSEE